MDICRSFRKENKVFLLLFVLPFLVNSVLAQAPASETVFATVLMMKAAPGKGEELEKFVKETMKPIHQLRLKKGKIIGWYFFRVHFTGANSDYNYVGVHYSNSWTNTDPNEDWPALMKEANPKADPVQLQAKMRELRTITNIGVYYREDNIVAKGPVKFIQIDFMKVKPGMYNDYLKLEKEEWKKFHAYNNDKGKSAGWGLWSRVLPGGSSADHDFITANRYSTYAQIGGINYPETFKAVFPEVDPNAAFDRADKTRDLVRSEIWELIADHN